MIQFRQKEFSEYDAMHSLYNELMRYGDKGKYTVIDKKALIPILKGNNVVIERFVISTYFLKKDKYRMYLKIGAKAKMPDEVRLPQSVYDKKLFNSTLNIGNAGGGGGDNKNQQKNHSEVADNTLERIKLFSDTIKQKEFGNRRGGGGNNNNDNNNGGGSNGLSVQAGFKIPVDISYEVRELLGEAISYNKQDRSLVLEFSSIQDAVRSLNILPFGINYKIYLLI